MEHMPNTYECRFEGDDLLQSLERSVAEAARAMGAHHPEVSFRADSYNKPRRWTAGINGFADGVLFEGPTRGDALGSLAFYVRKRLETEIAVRREASDRLSLILSCARSTPALGEGG